MNTYAQPRITGTCNHTNTEYDNFSGYVTGNYISEWQDSGGTRYRTIVTVVNLGRPDRGIPVDPDGAMVEEPLPYEERSLSTNYRASIVANAERRHSEALEIFTAYFQEHGPSPVRDLLGLTKWKNRIAINQHFRLFPDVYRYWPGLRYWGLHGQEAKVKDESQTS